MLRGIGVCLFVLLFQASVLAQVSPQTVKQIDEFFTELHRIEQFNGVALVAKDGKPVYHKAFGQANVEWSVPNAKDSTFGLGSLTKQFTGMTALQLAEKGKLDLQKPIAEYLPALKDKPAGTVTMHQLLTHTSGLPGNAAIWDFANNFAQPYNADVFIEKVKDWKLETEPGAKYSYSNSGYVLARVICEKISGEPFSQLLQKNIFEPLGMKHTGIATLQSKQMRRATGYERDFEGNLNIVPTINYEWILGAAGIYSTAEDLLKWEQAFNTEKLVSRKSIENFLTPKVNDSYSYGIGISKGKLPDNREITVIGHSGRVGGYHTHLRRLPDGGYTIILLNNTDIEADVSAISRAVTRILYAQPFDNPKQSIVRVFAKTYFGKGAETAFAEFEKNKADDKKFEFREDEINSFGYVLLGKKDVGSAIKVFKVNVEKFPQSSNVYDSLGEAYMIAGEKAEAIKNYEKSIELNPNNEGGKQMLKKLKGE
jgi:CubicO group peptidase (beta-lactamase class C family)